MISADDLASIIIERSGRWLDSWSVQKLLYYVQAWHLAVTGEPLFPEQIKAWKDGPVVPAVWRSRQDRSSRIASRQDTAKIDLDDDVSDLVDLVLAGYGSMSGEELSALTHVELPWLEARRGLRDDEPGSEPVDRTTMAEFYRSRRLLGGRTASDLAAAGVHPRAPGAHGALPVAELLAGLPEDLAEPGDDPWGGANLEAHAAR